MTNTQDFILRLMVLIVGTGFIIVASAMKWRKPEIEIFPVLLGAFGACCIVVATSY